MKLQDEGLTKSTSKLEQTSPKKLKANHKFKDMIQPVCIFIHSFVKFVLQNPILSQEFSLKVRKDLNNYSWKLDPTQRNFLFQTFIATKPTTQQQIQLYCFTDYPISSSVHIRLGFFHQALQYFHQSVLKQCTIMMKAMLSLITDIDIQKFVDGCVKPINQKTQSFNLQFFPTKLNHKNKINNQNDFKNYVRSYLNFLQKQVYESVIFDINGNIDKAQKPNKDNQIIGKKFEKSISALVSFWLWKLILARIAKKDNGKILTLKDCKLVFYLFLSGTVESQRILYTLLVGNIKPDNKQNVYLNKYLNDKIYRPKSKKSKQLGHKFLDEFLQQQALIRKLLKDYPITLEAKLLFLFSQDYKKLRKEDRQDLEKIQAKDLINSFDQEQFKVQIQRMKLMRDQKVNNINVLEKKIESKLFDMLMEDQLKKYQQLQSKLSIKPWAQINKPNQSIHKSILFSQLERINLILKSCIENIPGMVRQDKKGQWRVQKRFDPYVLQQAELAQKQPEANSSINHSISDSEQSNEQKPYKYSQIKSESAEESSGMQIGLDLIQKFNQIEVQQQPFLDEGQISSLYHRKSYRQYHQQELYTILDNMSDKRSSLSSLSSFEYQSANLSASQNLESQITESKSSKNLKKVDRKIEIPAQAIQFKKFLSQTVMVSEKQKKPKKNKIQEKRQKQARNKGEGIKVTLT